MSDGPSPVAFVLDLDALDEATATLRHHNPSAGTSDAVVTISRSEWERLDRRGRLFVVVHVGPNPFPDLREA